MKPTGAGDDSGAASGKVAELSGDRLDNGRCHQIAGGDPNIGLECPEFGADTGEGSRHDGPVERDHEDRQQQADRGGRPSQANAHALTRPRRR